MSSQNFLFQKKAEEMKSLLKAVFHIFIIGYYGKTAEHDWIGSNSKPY
jgi:hypothetical protein